MTEQEFQEALEDAVVTARNNGVLVRGNYVVDSENVPMDFEIEITRVVKN